MADIASAKVKMTDIEIAANAPLTETLHVKYGANINYLIDTTDSHTSSISSINTSLGQTVKTALVGPYSASQIINGGPTVMATVATLTTRGNPVFVWWIKGTHVQVTQLGAGGYEFTRNGTQVAQANPVAGGTVRVDDGSSSLLTATGIGTPSAKKLGNIVPFQHDTGPFAFNTGGINAYHTSPILLYSEAASTGTALTFGWTFVDQVTFTNDYYLIMY